MKKGVGGGYHRIGDVCSVERNTAQVVDGGRRERHWHGRRPVVEEDSAGLRRKMGRTEARVTQCGGQTSHSRRRRCLAPLPTAVMEDHVIVGERHRFRLFLRHYYIH